MLGLLSMICFVFFVSIFCAILFYPRRWFCLFFAAVDQEEDNVLELFDLFDLFDLLGLCDEQDTARGLKKPGDWAACELLSKARRNWVILRCRRIKLNNHCNNGLFILRSDPTQKSELHGVVTAMNISTGMSLPHAHALVLFVGDVTREARQRTTTESLRGCQNVSQETN